MTYLPPALAVGCPDCGAGPSIPCEPQDPTSTFGRRMIAAGLPHMARVEALAARHPNQQCACGRGPVAVEIEGRVLVCRDCADDSSIVRHARGDWR